MNSVTATKEDKVKARSQVQIAIQRGDLLPAKEMRCDGCGEPAEHWHHHNGYAPDHATDVVALCSNCHRDAHDGNFGQRRYTGPNLPLVGELPGTLSLEQRALLFEALYFLAALYPDRTAFHTNREPHEVINDARQDINSAPGLANLVHPKLSLLVDPTVMAENSPNYETDDA